MTAPRPLDAGTKTGYGMIAFLVGAFVLVAAVTTGVTVVGLSVASRVRRNLRG